MDNQKGFWGQLLPGPYNIVLKLMKAAIREALATGECWVLSDPRCSFRLSFTGGISFLYQTSSSNLVRGMMGESGE